MGCSTTEKAPPVSCPSILNTTPRPGPICRCSPSAGLIVKRFGATSTNPFRSGRESTLSTARRESITPAEITTRARPQSARPVRTFRTPSRRLAPLPAAARDPVPPKLGVSKLCSYLSRIDRVRMSRMRKHRKRTQISKPTLTTQTTVARGPAGQRVDDTLLCAHWQRCALSTPSSGAKGTSCPQPSSASASSTSQWR